MRATAGLLALAMLTACPEDPQPPPPPVSCFVGDPSLPPELVMVHRTPAGAVETTSTTVPLIQPPQGGKVLLVGVRARNVDGCPLNLQASLREPCSNLLVSVERRPVNMRPTGDGWLEPADPVQLSNFSNLGACPRDGLPKNVDGEPYLLRVVIEDKDKRTAELIRSVVPYCAEPELEALCRCECGVDYVLGQACDGARPDSGVAPGTCGDGGL